MLYIRNSPSKVRPKKSSKNICKFYNLLWVSKLYKIKLSQWRECFWGRRQPCISPYAQIGGWVGNRKIGKFVSKNTQTHRRRMNVINKIHNYILWTSKIEIQIVSQWSKWNMIGRGGLEVLKFWMACNDDEQVIIDGDSSFKFFYSSFSRALFFVSRVYFFDFVFHR